MNDAPATTAEQIAQTTRYTSYTVFRRLSGLTEDGELTEAQVAEALAQVTPLIEAEGAEILGFYDVSGFRAEADLMLWLAAEEPAAARPARVRALRGGHLAAPRMGGGGRAPHG
jgi:chlorite dismutase